MKKTFSFKLYRSKKTKTLTRQIDTAGWIYNHCIALQKRYYKLFKKYLDKYTLQKHITKLKKRKEYAAWKNLGSQAIQDITDRIDRAYQLYFDNIKARKAGKTKRLVAPPSFKKVKKYKSFTLKQAGYKILDGNKIKIGEKIFKFSKSRDIEGVVKTLTVKRNALGYFYIFFSCELPDVQINRTMTGKSAGFDFGLKTFLTSSDDIKIESPLFFKQAQKQLAYANKSLASKKRGSSNRHKAFLHLVRQSLAVANKRKDYHFKLAGALVKKYDVLYFEDLHIDAMKKLWGKKISDLGFSDFLKILEYKCLQAGVKIQFIDRFFPSSKLCHKCHFIKNDLSLSDRSWECSQCHVLHERDKNAAINILREGMSSLGVGKVRLPLGSVFCLIPESHDL